MMAAGPLDPTVASGTLAPVSSPFRHLMRVRYSECDLQGVVFNAQYLAYSDSAPRARASPRGGGRQVVPPGTVDQ